MGNFMQDLKEFFKGELREKHNFDTNDIITFYETINQNREDETIKTMIDECDSYAYNFQYIDRYEETGGYIKGEIKVELEGIGCSYVIILDNYNDSISISKKNNLNHVVFLGDIENYEDNWKQEIKEYKINQLKMQIQNRKEYIEKQNSKLKQLEKELLELTEVK